MLFTATVRLSDGSVNVMKVYNCTSLTEAIRNVLAPVDPELVEIARANWPAEKFGEFMAQKIVSVTVDGPYVR